jgi:hypothetical protein
VRPQVQAPVPPKTKKENRIFQYSLRRQLRKELDQNSGGLWHMLATFLLLLGSKGDPLVLPSNHMGKKPTTTSVSASVVSKVPQYPSIPQIHTICPTLRLRELSPREVMYLLQIIQLVTKFLHKPRSAWTPVMNP